MNHEIHAPARSAIAAFSSSGQRQTSSSSGQYSWHDVSNLIRDHVQTVLPQGLGARLQSVLPPKQTQSVRFGTVDVAPPGVYESPRDDADGRTLVHGEPRDALGGEVNAHEAASRHLARRG